MATDDQSNQPLVLVADDESHILNVVSLKLRKSGYAVITASDGQAALELARERKPSLLVTDYHMPHLSGVEFCRALADSGQRTPALLLTARDSDIDPAEREAAGIVEVINKPFSPRDLAGAVARHLPEAA